MMSRVFFATGGTELTRSFDATTPTNWYVCTVPDGISFPGYGRRLGIG